MKKENLRLSEAVEKIASNTKEIAINISSTAEMSHKTYSQAEDLKIFGKERGIGGEPGKDHFPKRAITAR